MGPLQLLWWRILGSNQSCPKAADLQSTASPLMLLLRTTWCEYPGSNRDTLRREILSLLCLPNFTILAFNTGVPPGTRTPTDSFGDCNAAITLGIHSFGGSGEIRTHGAFRHDSFQDCCNKPDSATLPLFGAPTETRTRTLAHWLLRPACLPIPPSGHNSLPYRCSLRRLNPR